MNKRKWTVACAVIAGVNLLFFLFFFLPASGKLKQVRNDMEEQVDRNKAGGENMILAGDLLNAVETSRRELKAHECQVPDISKRIEVLQSIEKISRESDSMETISLKMLDTNETDSEGVVKQLYRMDLKGSYREIAGVLHTLVYLQNLTTIESLTITHDKGKLLNANIVVACYFSNNGTETTDSNFGDGWAFR